MSWSSRSSGRGRRAAVARPARPRVRATASGAWSNLSGGVDQAWSRFAESRVGVRIVDWARLGAAVAEPVVRRVRAILATVSPLGWLVAGAAAILTGVGIRLGWQEFRIAGLALALLVALSVLFTLGRTHLAVRLEVEPTRMQVGDSAAARVSARNVARTPLVPVGLQVPVGVASARFTLPALAPGATFEDFVAIPSSYRGVIPVGPARTQRGDPFGLLRREVVWTPVVELFVHPRIVPLDSLGTGLLRDLEGQTTNNTSMSDLAFHTLREYVPGDDRRYIHWRSSAKLSGAAGQGQFLVRQFLDTRRSHMAVVTDVSEAAYRSAEEFELAISAAASVTARALVDHMDLTIVCGEHSVTAPAPHAALDTYARAEFEDHSLPESVGRLAVLAPDVSTVVVVTGALTEFAAFQLCRAHLAPEVRLFALHAEQGAPLALREAGGFTVMTLGELRELPLLLAGGVTE